MPAVDPNFIKGQVDANLTDNIGRNNNAGVVRTLLKSVIDWVATAVNTNLSTWYKVGTANQPATNADNAYHAGKIVVGRNAEDGTGANLQVQGSVSLGGIVAPNGDGLNPPTQNLPGQGFISFLANWGITGISDIALVNTNFASGAITFWQMLTPTTKKLLLALRDGRVGIGTTNPAESLEVAGRIKTNGLMAAGGTPTVAAQSGLGTGGTAQIIGGSTDQSGRVRLNTGSSATNGNAAYAIITFSQAFDVAPRFLQFTPRNQAACREMTKFYVDGISSTQAVIFGSNGGNPTAGLSFDFDYFIVK